MSSEAVRARGLSKRYLTGRTEGLFRYRSLREELAGRVRRGARTDGGDGRELWALRDVSLEIAEGETVGVIGRNGAGKSTLLKILSGITAPTAGRVEVRGRVGSLLEVGTGFHPELTGRENVLLAGAVLGMRRAEIRGRLDEIVAFAGVERFLDTPVKRYSSGMYLRLAFAVAAHLEAEVLLVDEVLAVGDVEFQRKCLGRMAEIGAGGRTVVFVSHSMPAVMRLCERVLLFDGGRLVADGTAQDVIRAYLDSGLGTTASREWPSPLEAPGDDVARLRAVRVRDSRGALTEEIDITRPFTVEVEYWHLSGDPSVRPYVALHFSNDAGTCLFVTADYVNERWWNEPRRLGVVRAECHVPGNLLAEGRVFVRAAIGSLGPTRVHADEHDAVAFQVVERGGAPSARGPYTNDVPGAVRPLLEWRVEPVDRLEVPAGTDGRSRC